MKIYKHDNYDQYIKIQRQHVNNHQKLLQQNNLTADDGDVIGWATDEHLTYVYDRFCYYNKSTNPLILCHGVRNGYEVSFFRKCVGFNNVFSTDLFDVFMYDKTNFFVQDFDTDTENWIEKFDLVYSNSFDHSRDPFHTFKIWSKQVKNKGLLISTIICGFVTPSDCSAFDTNHYIEEIKSLTLDTPMEVLEISDPTALKRKKVVNAIFIKEH